MFYRICFLVIFGDVCVLVKPEHFRVGVEGQTSDVVYVTLINTLLRGIVKTARGKPENIKHNSISE